MLTLVTGSTGLLGNNIVRLLLERGESVRVLVRNTQSPPPLQGLQVDVVQGDLQDVDAIRRAVEGADCVIHSAGFVRIGWSGLDESRAINVTGTRFLAEAALAQQARFVHVSTVNTFGLGQPDQPADEETPPLDQVRCPYVISKSEGEQVIRELVQQGLQGCIVNPGFMLGPWDWKPSSGAMLCEVVKRFTPAAPTGGCSVVDVRDVAAGCLAAAAEGQPGRNYILAGENMSYLELWQRIARLCEATPPRFRMGPLIRWLGGSGGDFWYRVTGREPLVNSAAVKMSAQFHHYSSQRAATELGYQFRNPDEAIRDAHEWFREHGYL